jgi:hypothetical protein
MKKFALFFVIVFCMIFAACGDDPVTHTITFMDADGTTILATQTVKDGQAASEPALSLLLEPIGESYVTVPLNFAFGG